MLACNQGFAPKELPLCDWTRTYLPDEGLDTTGTTVGLVEGNLTNDLGTVLPAIISLSEKISLVGRNWGRVDILAELLDLLDLGGQAVGESLLQGLLRRR